MNKIQSKKEKVTTFRNIIFFIPKTMVGIEEDYSFSVPTKDSKTFALERSSILTLYPSRDYWYIRMCRLEAQRFIHHFLFSLMYSVAILLRTLRPSEERIRELSLRGSPFLSFLISLSFSNCWRPHLMILVEPAACLSDLQSALRRPP